MSTVFNTSYKVHVQHTNQAEVDSVNIEDGAMLHTTDADFVTNGTDWKVTANGGSAKIWDIIYFIQRTQNADFS